MYEQEDFILKINIMLTIKWYKIKLLQEDKSLDIKDILLKNRWIEVFEQKWFFNPSFDDLLDPFLFDWMNIAVERILKAKVYKERVIVFWDYDVDWVSSTAMLVRFLSEIWLEVSYRLPHRANDWYWLKTYLIDEISEKNVSLIITVDCWTRDIEAINHANSLWIDIIITDHHIAPEILPENVVAIINPKLEDSKYPNKYLSWSWVTFKLLHAICKNIFSNADTLKYLKKYIDFAMLWTISDCMPLTWENRVIAFLWLKQLKNSCSCWLKKLIEWTDPEKLDGDIIWFKVWPRLNAAWRMDSPYKALRVLLTWEKNLDEAIKEIENLNSKRKTSTEIFIKHATDNIDINKNVIFYESSDIWHWIIGLIAWRLCEAHNKTSIVLKNERERLIASCRSPGYINIISILEEFKDMFLVFWGHDQAAGFSILKENFSDFKDQFEKRVSHLSCNIDIIKYIEIDLALNMEEINFNLIEIIEKMRPFWYSNPKPIFMIKNIDFKAIEYLWKEQKHLKIFTNYKNININAFWFWEYLEILKKAENISIIFELERNVWNNKESISLNVRDIVLL